MPKLLDLDCFGGFFFFFCRNTNEGLEEELKSGDFRLAHQARLVC